MVKHTHIRVVRGDKGEPPPHGYESKAKHWRKKPKGPRLRVLFINVQGFPKLVEGTTGPQRKKWRKVLNRDPCAYCGLRRKGVSRRTMDHIVPKSAGGRDGWENRIGACLRCDNRKGPKPLLLYLLELRSDTRS